jgi:hypothetical protein
MFRRARSVMTDFVSIQEEVTEGISSESTLEMWDKAVSFALVLT